MNPVTQWILTIYLISTIFCLIRVWYKEDYVIEKIEKEDPYLLDQAGEELIRVIFVVLCFIPIINTSLVFRTLFKKIRKIFTPEP